MGVSVSESVSNGLQDLEDLSDEDYDKSYWVTHTENIRQPIRVLFAEPLIYAILSDNLPALKSELKDPKILENFRSKHYPPPLQLACSIGRLPLVKALMDIGEIDLAARDETGVTAFHCSCSAEYLEEGVDDDLVDKLVNLLDANGQTFLHRAAVGLNPSVMVPYLLEKGSSALILDNSDKLPSDCCNDPKTTRMLEEIVYEFLGKQDKSSTESSNNDEQGSDST